jgi:hypothetical protein
MITAFADFSVSADPLENPFFPPYPFYTGPPDFSRRPVFYQNRLTDCAFVLKELLGSRMQGNGYVWSFLKVHILEAAVHSIKILQFIVAVPGLQDSIEQIIVEILGRENSVPCPLMVWTALSCLA